MTFGKKIEFLVTTEDERLVKRVVRKVCSQHYSGSARELEEDLHHYGLVGLIEAKKSFDQSKGIPFAAFAVHRIRGAMLDPMRKAPMIRLPQKKQDQRKLLEQARTDLRGKGLEESESNLCRQLGWSAEQVHRVRAMQPRVVSLAFPAHCNGDSPQGDEPEQDLPAAGPGPEEHALKEELAMVVRQCLEKISTARDRLILIGRIYQERKLRELAVCLDCTVETVRLRQLKALESMKRCLISHGWDEDSIPDIKG